MSDLRFFAAEELMNNYVKGNNIDKSFAEWLNDLTPAKKEFAKTVLELYKREQNKNIDFVHNAEDIYNLMRPLLCDLNVEEAWVILMAKNYKVLKKVRLHVGTYDGTIFDARQVLKEALLHNATIFAIVHNHPSGNINPSRQDDELTNKIAKAAQVMGIYMVDHVIITSNSYYSFREDGKL